MPFSSVAYRCHILIALIASSFLVLFFHLLIELLGKDRRLEALTATLFLCSTPLFVEQARVVEVLTLNALFAAAIIFCLIKNELVLGSFLFGLGLGNHHTLLAVAPLFLLIRDRKSVPYQAIFFLVGLSVYAYLPIRAQATPPVNFGDPETWSRFWSVVTRREFGALSLHPAALPFRNAGTVLQQSGQFLHRALEHGGWIGLVLALIGIFAPGRRRIALIAVGGWLAVGWGFEIYSNLSPFSDIGQWRLVRFYIAPLAASAVLVALGLEVITRRAPRAVAWIIFMGGLIGSTSAALSRPSFRSNLVFRDFALSTMRCAPKDARVVIDRIFFDEPTSSLLVTRLTENKRADIKFFYRPGTLFDPVYGKDLLDLTWDQRFRRQHEVETKELTGASFPIRFLGFEKESAPFENPRLRGLLYSPTDESVDASPFIVRRPALPPDYPSRLIDVHIPYLLGKAALESAQGEQAHRWFKSAIAASGGMAWLLSNVGGLYARAEWLDEASWAFNGAVALDPYFYPAQFGLGYVCLKRNDPNGSVRAFESAVRVGPDHADGFYMLGVAAQSAGDKQKAASAWQTYLALEPSGKMASVVKQQLEESKWK